MQWKPLAIPECDSLTSSRKIRFSRFLVTAFPARRPTTIPIRDGSWMGTRLTRRVKNGLRTTDPLTFTPSYSYFFFKKNGKPSPYSSETVKRCRPFFRRRARTFLPFLVLMRWHGVVLLLAIFLWTRHFMGGRSKSQTYFLLLTLTYPIDSLTGFWREDIVEFSFPQHFLQQNKASRVALH